MATYNRKIMVLPATNKLVMKLINQTPPNSAAWVVDEKRRLLHSFKRNKTYTNFLLFSENPNEILILLDSKELISEALFGDNARFKTMLKDCRTGGIFLGVILKEEDLPLRHQFLKDSKIIKTKYHYLGFSCEKVENEFEKKYIFWFKNNFIEFFGKYVPFEYFFLQTGL